MRIPVLLCAFLASKIVAQLEYDCATDGIPSAVVIIGQGASRSVETFIPLFANCNDANNGIPKVVLPGVFRNPALFYAKVPGSTVELPGAGSSFQVTGIADSEGFTGTDAALNVARFFPLDLMKCIAVVRGTFQTFTDEKKTVSSSGDPLPLTSISCAR
jgi:hypothetical protein